MEQLFDISDIQQANIFRVSTILYSNNTYDISPRQVHKKIIEDCLYQVYPNRLTAVQIHQNILDSLVLTFSPEEIEQTLRDTRFKDVFIEIPEPEANLYTLTQVDFDKIDAKKDKPLLSDFIDEYLRELQIDSAKAEIILRFLYLMFTSNVESFRRLMQSNSVAHAVSNQEWTEEERDIINGFLDWDNPSKNIAIFNLASYAIEYCTLTNKRGTNIKIDSLRNKTFYLDTNILYRALGINGEDRMIRTNIFLSKFKEVNGKLLITKITQKEYSDSIDAYMKRLRKSEAPSINSKLYNEYVTYDDIYRTYHKWRVGKAASSVEIFAAHLQSDYERMLERYSIIVDTEIPIDFRRSAKKLNKMALKIMASNDKKTYETAMVDAKNVCWVETKRQGKDDSVFSAKYFFISSDSSLCYWDSRHYSDNVQIVMPPSQWLSLLLRYVDRTDDDFRSFVCFLNIRSDEQSFDQETMSAILSGISQITTDINDQRHIVETLLNNDFKRTAKSMTNEQIKGYTQKFAERELQKKVEQMEKNHSQQIDAMKQQINQQGKQYEEDLKKKDDEITQSRQDISQLRQDISQLRQESVLISQKADDSQKENAKLKDVLKESQDDVKYYKRKHALLKEKLIWGALWTILLFFFVGIYLWILFAKDDSPIMGKFLRWTNNLHGVQEYAAKLLVNILLIVVIVAVFKKLFNLLSRRVCNDE